MPTENLINLLAIDPNPVERVICVVCRTKDDFDQCIITNGIPYFIIGNQSDKSSLRSVVNFIEFVAYLNVLESVHFTLYGLSFDSIIVYKNNDLIKFNLKNRGVSHFYDIKTKHLLQSHLTNCVLCENTALQMHHLQVIIEKNLQRKSYDKKYMRSTNILALQQNLLKRITKDLFDELESLHTSITDMPLDVDQSLYIDKIRNLRSCMYKMSRICFENEDDSL